MIYIFWAMTLSKLVNTIVTIKDDFDCVDPNMSVACSSKMPLTIYQLTKHHIKNQNLHPHHCNIQNLMQWYSLQIDI